jgi:5-formyltetrahydrofolate cyclo-ligase
LRGLSRDLKQHKSLLIQSQLKKLLNGESGAWVAFQPMSDEPQVAWPEVSSEISWAFPKIENNKMSFCASVQNFEKSDLGFNEPVDGEYLPLERIDGFVIPGVAFDKSGFRLGRGKGYYDRALANFAGAKIGVCFDLSLCDQLPHEAHDVRCTQIVTENEVVEVRKSQGDSQWN